MVFENREKVRRKVFGFLVEGDPGFDHLIAAPMIYVLFYFILYFNFIYHLMLMPNPYF